MDEKIYVIDLENDEGIMWMNKKDGNVWWSRHSLNPNSSNKHGGYLVKRNRGNDAAEIRTLWYQRAYYYQEKIEQKS